MIPMQRSVHRQFVVIAGPTSSGKTTLAAHLHHAEHLDWVGASTLLMQTAGTERPKAERLLSWLDTGATGRRAAVTDADRLADLRVLHACAGSQTGIVVETCGPAGLLLDPLNLALLIRVEAAIPVRAMRLLGHLAGLEVSAKQAELILTRKDAAMATAIRTAWGLDLTDPASTRWRFDLLIGCPDQQVCRDPRECAEASRVLAQAALKVYRCFLEQRDGAEAVAALQRAWTRFAPWVARVAPVLADPSGPFTASRWRTRLLEEHNPTQPSTVEAADAELG